MAKKLTPALTREEKVDIISTHFKKILDVLGVDPKDPSTKDTPKRVAKMYVDELCSSLSAAPPEITTFPNDAYYDQMLIVDNITVRSLCEHHFQNIIGKCYIAYMPDTKLMGLSKFSRIVQYFASKPQVQERLTQQIADYLKSVLLTEDIAILIRAEHHCMKCRGVKEENSMTTTIYMGGIFRQHSVKSEFLNLINVK